MAHVKRNAIVFMIVLALGACGKKGKTCDTDGKCDGEQVCWCARRPLADKCVDKEDLPGGECVSRDERSKRLNAATAAAERKGEDVKKTVLHTLYPKCETQFKQTDGFVLVGGDGGGPSTNFIMRADVPFTGEVCDDDEKKDTCSKGDWTLTVSIVFEVSFDDDLKDREKLRRTMGGAIHDAGLSHAECSGVCSGARQFSFKPPKTIGNANTLDKYMAACH